jgi:hypothetical protein
LALTSGGDLLVVETWTQQLSLVELGTGPAVVTPLLTGLEVGQPAPAGFPPIWNFDGVAVGPSGAIYLAAGGILQYVLRD